MRRLDFGLLACIVCAVAWPVSLPRAENPRGGAWLELTETATGRSLHAGLLREGEEVVLTWTNSLFKLQVTEVFVARSGRLELNRVTFAAPGGPPPPRARPEDLDDLYHTGGPFHIEGLARPFTRIVFRVGAVGDPHLTVGARTLSFREEAGFGGAILLEARSP